MNRTLTLAALALCAAVSAQAQVRVDDPWVRTTVPEQKSTGAFMAVTSAQGGKLVSASSPVATSVEVHEDMAASLLMPLLPVGLAVLAGAFAALWRRKRAAPP